MIQVLRKSSNKHILAGPKSWRQVSKLVANKYVLAQREVPNMDPIVHLVKMALPHFAGFEYKSHTHPIHTYAKHELSISNHSPSLSTKPPWVPRCILCYVQRGVSYQGALTTCSLCRRPPTIGNLYNFSSKKVSKTRVSYLGALIVKPNKTQPKILLFHPSGLIISTEKNKFDKQIGVMISEAEGAGAGAGAGAAHLAASAVMKAAWRGEWMEARLPLCILRSVVEEVEGHQLLGESKMMIKIVTTRINTRKDYDNRINWL